MFVQVKLTSIFLNKVWMGDLWTKLWLKRKKIVI